MPQALKPTAKFVEEYGALEKIRQNPQLSKPLKHEAGVFSERAANFRIVFEISGGDIILHRVRKRDDAY